MAFLGSVGKLFGISTPEAARIGASFATGGLGQAALTTLQSLGDTTNVAAARPVDVSAPPAGVDSAATLAPVSQTAMIQRQSPGAMGGVITPSQTMPNQAFIGGFGVPGLIGTATRALSRLPSGKLVGATGALLAADTFIDIFGNEKKLVITRKLQRDVKRYLC